MRGARAALRAAEEREATIRRAGSLGALERLAGVGQSPDERYAFWSSFSHLPGARALDAGAAELKRRIRAQPHAVARPCK